MKQFETVSSLIGTNKVTAAAKIVLQRWTASAALVGDHVAADAFKTSTFSH